MGGKPKTRTCECGRVFTRTTLKCRSCSEGRAQGPTKQSEAVKMAHAIRTATENRECANACGRPYYARGFCRPCYKKGKRTGDIKPSYRRVAKPANDKCTESGCDHKYYAKGFCMVHYNKNRLRRHGDDKAGVDVFLLPDDGITDWVAIGRSLEGEKITLRKSEYGRLSALQGMPPEKAQAYVTQQFIAQYAEAA